MKNKIGILTLPLSNNYGGIIQLVALYHFLESKGYQPLWIDKRKAHTTLKKVIINLLQYNPFYKIYDPKNFRNIKIFQKQIEPFLKVYLPYKTMSVASTSQLNEVTKNCQTVVVGSDQVWRLEYVKDNYPSYFLNFIDSNIKKISYAASFGKDYWEGDEKSIKIIKPLLANFDLISVREDTAVSICKNTFNIEKAHHVLDPTLLPDPSFYKKMVTSIKFNKKIELFNYVLDSNPENDLLIKKVAERSQLKVTKIHLNKQQNSRHPLIENWLANFYYADFIVTDSFHGMIFSIIFNKQFLVIGNRERGLTRFSSLLKLLDLEERLIDANQINTLENRLKNTIDYQKVNATLEILRLQSINIFLEKI